MPKLVQNPEFSNFDSAVVCMFSVDYYIHLTRRGHVIRVFSKFSYFFVSFCEEVFTFLSQKCRMSIIYENPIVFKGTSTYGLCIVLMILAPEESCWSILLPSNHFMVCSKPGSQRKYTLKSVTKAKMRNVTPE